VRKNVLVSLAVLVIFAGGLRTYFRLTDDFRLANIQYEQPYRKEWEIESKKNLTTILNQPYSYIGKGSQSYAFASADGNYVLKFFKYKHLRPHWLLETVSSLPYFKEYREKQLKRKGRKLEHLFAGYHLAWTTLREESGLEFIHLNQTVDSYPEVILYDKIGLKRTVDLDSVVFIVQKKAQTTRAVIDALLTQGDVATAKLRLRQILTLYASEYRRGIYDMDHGVMHNTGFVGESPIHLDIGKLTREPKTLDPTFRRADIQKVVARMMAWIKESYPEYAQEIMNDINLTLKEIR
jgi:hypothetical protein